MISLHPRYYREQSLKDETRSRLFYGKHQSLGRRLLNEMLLKLQLFSFPAAPRLTGASVVRGPRLRAREKATTTCSSLSFRIYKFQIRVLEQFDLLYKLHPTLQLR